jgi:mutator protein MutT
MAPPHLTPVVAVVVERAGRYLVGQRPLAKRHGGLWEFPGGKIAPGEGIQQAARREVREEMGVELTSVGREIGALSDDQVHIRFIEATLETEPHAFDHAELRWCQVSDLIELDLAPIDQRFVLLKLLS